MNAITFSALAEPNRLKIVELLRLKPMSVNEIALSLAIRQPQASKHLIILSKSGLVKVRRMAQRHIYELQPDEFKSIETWVQSFDSCWSDRFNRLDDFLTTKEE